MVLSCGFLVGFCSWREIEREMERGKDDERMMGPMFPRLHVNDTEKGGPRAPPRNKMALYEQLSIPSQRFNSLNRNNPAAVAVVPPAPSSHVRLTSWFL